jgi:hypothetical protein
MSDERITPEQFEKRLVDLCVSGGLTGLPRRPVDREILYTGVLATLPRDRTYTQEALNAELGSWLVRIAESLEVDHVTLRREMVDRGFLVREPDGSRYRAVVPDWWSTAFDEAVLEVDVSEVVERGRDQRQRRKRAHAEHDAN